TPSGRAARPHARGGGRSRAMPTPAAGGRGATTRRQRPAAGAGVRGGSAPVFASLAEEERGEHPRLPESPRTKDAAVADPAGAPVRRWVVAAVGQAVVEAERDTPAHDVRLGHRDERRVHPHAVPLDAGAGAQVGDLLEGGNEFRPT